MRPLYVHAAHTTAMQFDIESQSKSGRRGVSAVNGTFIVLIQILQKIYSINFRQTCTVSISTTI
jgi:hypothetical protein